MPTHYVSRTIRAAHKLIANKGILWLLTALLYLIWILLPQNIPFAEVLYAVLISFSIASITPIVRVLLFPEAAEFAETGDLRNAFKIGKFTPELIHYWYATFLSFAAAALALLFIAAH